VLDAAEAWDPPSIRDTCALFDGAPFRWWISGGHALELHTGRSWRDHDDIDVGVCRDDHANLRRWLDGWQIALTAGGVLTEWDGAELVESMHHNNLWCRRDREGRWAIDVTIGSGTRKEWIYRRDSSIRRPWSAAVLYSAARVPYLAPDLQLLFKSASPRPKDDLDAAEVVPVSATTNAAVCETSSGSSIPGSRCSRGPEPDAQATNPAL